MLLFVKPTSITFHRKAQQCVCFCLGEFACSAWKGRLLNFERICIRKAVGRVDEDTHHVKQGHGKPQVNIVLQVYDLIVPLR
jgi:hypothetical protein